MGPWIPTLEYEKHQEDDDFFFRPHHFAVEWNDMTFEIKYHLFARILGINEMCTPPIVRAKNFNFGRKLGLNIGMKKSGSREDFTFRPQKIDPCETTIVINKSDKVLVMSMRYNRCYPPYITMNHIKSLSYI